MKPVWPYLGDRAPDSRRDSDIAKNAENRGNRGKRGNKPRNIGGSRIPAPGNCSGTQKCRANSFVPAVPLVPAENDVPGDNRDRWNQRIPRTAHPPGLVGHYTRCLDCTRYAPLPSDTAFWCPAVRGCPDVSLWVTCTAYEARPGTPTGPTAPSDMASTR